MKLADILKGSHKWDGKEYQPEPYVHQEYPKMVDGKIVKTEEEHKALLADAPTVEIVVPEKPKKAK